MSESFETLIECVRRCDKRAERMLVELLYHPVFQIAYSITKDVATAEDIVQETFIKVFAKIDTLQQPEKIEAWVMTIARRTTYDTLRKQKKWNETVVKTVDIDEAVFVDTPYEEQEIQVIVEATINALPPMQREILRLKLVEGYTDEAIARELSIKVGTVKSRIHRAKEKVKDRLVKGGDMGEAIE